MSKRPKDIQPNADCLCRRPRIVNCSRNPILELEVDTSGSCICGHDHDNEHSQIDQKTSEEDSYTFTCRPDDGLPYEQDEHFDYNDCDCEIRKNVPRESTNKNVDDTKKKPDEKKKKKGLFKCLKKSSKTDTTPTSDNYQTNVRPVCSNEECPVAKILRAKPNTARTLENYQTNVRRVCSNEQCPVAALLRGKQETHSISDMEQHVKNKEFENDEMREVEWLHKCSCPRCGLLVAKSELENDIDDTEVIERKKQSVKIMSCKLDKNYNKDGIQKFICKIVTSDVAIADDCKYKGFDRETMNRNQPRLESSGFYTTTATSTSFVSEVCAKGNDRQYSQGRTSFRNENLTDNTDHVQYDTRESYDDRMNEDNHNNNNRNDESDFNYNRICGCSCSCKDHHNEFQNCIDNGTGNVILENKRKRSSTRIRNSALPEENGTKLTNRALSAIDVQCCQCRDTNKSTVVSNGKNKEKDVYTYCEDRPEKNSYVYSTKRPGGKSYYNGDNDVNINLPTCSCDDNSMSVKNAAYNENSRKFKRSTKSSYQKNANQVCNNNIQSTFTLYVANNIPDNRVNKYNKNSIYQKRRPSQVGNPDVSLICVKDKRMHNGHSKRNEQQGEPVIAREKNKSFLSKFCSKLTCKKNSTKPKKQAKQQESNTKNKK